MNFYENPQRSHQILADLLQNDNRNSIYIQGFIGTEIPTIESLDEWKLGERNRSQRRILIYWAYTQKRWI